MKKLSDVRMYYLDALILSVPALCWCPVSIPLCWRADQAVDDCNPSVQRDIGMHADIDCEHLPITICRSPFFVMASELAHTRQQANEVGYL